MRRALQVTGLIGAVAFHVAASSIFIEGDPAVVCVAGSKAVAAASSKTDWSAGALRVSVDQPGAPALAGTYRVEGDALIFTPRYRLQSGLAYRVVFSFGGDKIEAVVNPAARAESAAAFVERIFPSSEIWPENQLRLYLQFSAPMSRGEAFDRLHLIDLSTNTETKAPFLEIQEELWDREQKRLTILFDPGRVKRGLVPNQEVGPPLVEGRRYRLVVDADWKDATSRPLAKGFSKEFVAGPGVREGIDLRQWKLTTPTAGSREPLTVEFPRALDAGLLQRCLTIEGVAGQMNLDRDETRWTFVPDAPWASRQYQLRVERSLEDLAGNRLGRAFDVDLDVFDRVAKSSSAGAAERIAFTPR